MILGVAGKMGPTLARLAKNAAPHKRVIGVARFSNPQARAMLENHLIKRKVDPQVLDPQKIEPSGKLVHQVIKLKDGLDSDTAKKIVKLLKENGYKVQASIQGDKVRVTDKKRDTLQDVMALLREQKFGVPLQFNNFKD